LVKKISKKSVLFLEIPNFRRIYRIDQRLLYVKNELNPFSRLDRTPMCDRQTDRQTDTQIPIANTALYHLVALVNLELEK